MLKEKNNQELIERSFKPQTLEASQLIFKQKDYHKLVQPNLRHLSRNFHVKTEDSSLCSISNDGEDVNRSVKLKRSNGFDRLFQDSKSRLYRKQNIYQGMLDKECTFRPKISQNIRRDKRCTTSMLNNTDNDISKQYIFRDPELTFHPKINNPSPAKTAREKKSIERNQLEFFQREDEKRRARRVELMS